MLAIACTNVQAARLPLRQYGASGADRVQVSFILCDTFVVRDFSAYGTYMQECTKLVLLRVKFETWINNMHE
jgi:hypothetical protein